MELYPILTLSLKGFIMNRQIIITAKDLERLRKLISQEREFGKIKDSIELISLEKELSKAFVVDEQEIPSHVITMNSKFTVTNLETEEEIDYTLVYPEDADIFEDKISIMAPIGTAVLGYGEGDIFDWHVPGGIVQYRIDKILYQPESSGDFEL